MWVIQCMLRGIRSLIVLCFGMCEDVRLEVGGLGKFLVAAVKWAHVRAVPRVDAHMGAQVKVQGESLATALKCALETRKIKSHHRYLNYERLFRAGLTQTFSALFFQGPPYNPQAN